MRLCSATDLPTICSVCRQPPAAYEPKLTYVNAESAYDGPVVKDEANPHVPGVYVENIVICELCVREMARLLPDSYEAQAVEAHEAWKSYSENLEEEIAEKDRAISDLTYTVGTLIDKPVKRRPGRPQLRGPESHEDTIKELRSRANKPKKKETV